MFIFNGYNMWKFKRLFGYIIGNKGDISYYHKKNVYKNIKRRLKKYTLIKRFMPIIDIICNIMILVTSLFPFTLWFFVNKFSLKIAGIYLLLTLCLGLLTINLIIKTKEFKMYQKYL